jgi:hypothetical protein
MAHEAFSSRARSESPTEDSKVVTFGDLVAAAFARAELVTTDPPVVAALASRALGRWLGRTGRPDIAQRLQPPHNAKRALRRPTYSRAA